MCDSVRIWDENIALLMSTLPGASRGHRSIFESSRGEHHSLDGTGRQPAIVRCSLEATREIYCFPLQERRKAAEAQLKAAKATEEALCGMMRDLATNNQTFQKHFC